MNLKEQRAAIVARLKELRSITRDFTAAEVAEIEKLAKDFDTINDRIARNDKTTKALAEFASGPADDDFDFELDEDGDVVRGLFAGGAKQGYATGLARPDGKGGLGRKLAVKMAKTANGKSLAASGSVLESVQLLSETPVERGRVASSMLDVLPLIGVEGGRYAYLRQTSRENNAARVARGAVKPTSEYEIDRVEAELKVVAHLSDGIDKYMLQDLPSLGMFVSAELLYGLSRALEDQVLNGTGVGANLRGFFHTTGVQAQMFVEDDGLTDSWVRTARAAITKLEAEGGTPAAFFVSPGDWELAETIRTSDGTLDLSVRPIDAATRRLWSVPVVVCQTLDDGAGVLLGDGAAALATDTRGVEIRWSESVGESFERNELRARCEGRFELAVARPSNVVTFETVEGGLGS